MLAASHTRRHAQRGLTLVELLVSLAILSLLLIILFSTLHMGIQSWERLGARVDQYDKQRLGLMFLKRQLAQAVPLLWVDDSGERLVFEGSRERITFVARMPEHAGPPGLYLIVVQPNADSRSTALHLTYRLLHSHAGPFDPAPSDVDTGTATLVEDIAAVRFQYHGVTDPDSVSAWHTEWHMESMPGLIRLSVATNDGAGEPIDLLIPVYAHGTSHVPQLTMTPPHVRPPNTGFPFNEVDDTVF